MDEHKEKAEENKFQESSEQHQAPRNEEADEEKDRDSAGESVDQHQEGCKEERNDGEEAATAAASSSSPSFLEILAHPCSLLQYMLRASAGWCWGALHGGAFDDAGPKPQTQQPAAAGAVAPEAVPPATNSTEKGDGGGEKDDYDNCFYMEEEVVTRVWAVRRGRPPGAPSHPRGENGGVHH